MPVPFGTLPSRSVDRHVASCWARETGSSWIWRRIWLWHSFPREWWGHVWSLHMLLPYVTKLLLYVRTNGFMVQSVLWACSVTVQHAPKPNRTAAEWQTDSLSSITVHNSVRGCCQCCCLEEANNACRPALATRHKDAYDPTRMKPSAYALPNKSLFFLNKTGASIY
jgi:hypothetical protein